jgi:hypothetical protein
VARHPARAQLCDVRWAGVHAALIVGPDALLQHVQTGVKAREVVRPLRGEVVVLAGVRHHVEEAAGGAAVHLVADVVRRRRRVGVLDACPASRADLGQGGGGSGGEGM